ncbi:acyl-CoA dehydrogenase family protein [Janibacter cremeus]|uniref:acyl-CoA dehydrogenase family protein n=1 Tax=Janibacter cremeus TaxID=1285192 RepID=UPI0023F6FC2F|nr:acyl-CoA dehydrogenase family protein [Janibacter cremeus]WEV77036.1 acyl-CoA dehydrogenase family protein [Janibacter cremeus]
MHRRLSADDSAFQQRMRDYFTTEFPQDLRTKVAAGDKLSPEDIRRSQATLAEAGLAVPGWPTEWGGQDWTPLQKHIWNSELQAAGVPPPLPFNTSMVGPVIAAFGSEGLKRRFLPKTATAEIWWCQGFSEPGAGSDLASLRTTAVRDGDEYVVTGQKTWTTLGQHADWMFALVRTDPDAPKKQAGISFLLLDMRSEGVTVSPIRTLDGGVEVNDVFLDEVRVPADQLVGEENRGWDYAKFLLGNERVGVANTGLIKRWLVQLKEHAQQVRLGDGTLLADPAIAARFAEVEAQLMSVELTAVRVSGTSEDGRPDPASSILKLCGSQLQQDVLELAVDISGPMALVWDALDSVPEWAAQSVPTYLNYRKATIYGGSSEVQRSIVAGTILGLKG